MLNISVLNNGVINQINSVVDRFQSFFIMEKNRLALGKNVIRTKFRPRHLFIYQIYF